MSGEASGSSKKIDDLTIPLPQQAQVLVDHAVQELRSGKNRLRWVRTMSPLSKLLWLGCLLIREQVSLQELREDPDLSLL